MSAWWGYYWVVAMLLYALLARLPALQRSPQVAAGWAAHGLALLIPLSFYALLYHPVLEAWWMFDDPALLHYVHRANPLQGFYDPTVKLPFYTPWLGLSYAVDYYLFDLEHQFYYAHHLLSFMVALVLLYVLLRLSLTPWLASMGLLLFLANAPVAQVSQFLMTRHYLEGLSFTLLALLAYLRAQREQRLSWALVGALCYALAATTKEIYLPLPLILLLLAGRDWRARLPLLIPFAVVALAYVPLRFYMLGGATLSTIYSEGHTGWTEILQLPWIYAQQMGWTAPWQWGLAALAWLGVLGLLWRAPRRLGWPLLVWTLVLWLPLLPILWRIPRYHFTYYLFLPALLTAVAWVWMLGEWMLRYPRWRQTLGGLGFALLLAANFSALAQEQKRLAGDLEGYREQGQFLIYHRSQDPEVLIYPTYAIKYLLFMRDVLLPEHGIQTGNLGHCAEVNCLCQLTYAGQTAWFYQKGTWQQKQLPTEVPAHCATPKP